MTLWHRASPRAQTHPHARQGRVGRRTSPYGEWFVATPNEARFVMYVLRHTGVMDQITIRLLLQICSSLPPLSARILLSQWPKRTLSSAWETPCLICRLQMARVCSKNTNSNPTTRSSPGPSTLRCMSTRPFFVPKHLIDNNILTATRISTRTIKSPTSPEVQPKTLLAQQRYVPHTPSTHSI